MVSVVIHQFKRKKVQQLASDTTKGESSKSGNFKVFACVLVSIFVIPPVFCFQFYANFGYYI